MSPQAEVDNIIFRNPENGYTIASLKIDGSPVTAVLTSPSELVHGQQIEIEGEMVNHPKYGPQLKASKISIPEPTSEEGIKAYLSSGIISGIGPKMAQRIVDRFGEQTMATLDDEPQMLLDIRGIAQKTLQRIIDSWKKNRESHIIIGKLYEMGLTITQANKVYKTFADQSVHVVKENPYRLADEVSGIGFRRADEIAEKIGIDKGHPHRITSGVLYALKEATNAGHCYLPKDRLTATATQILDLPEESVAQTIQGMINSARIIKRPVPAKDGIAEACYLPPIFHAEKYIEKKLTSLSHSTKHVEMPRLSTLLTQEQKAAATNALHKCLSVITGPAGSGKTYIIKEIIRCLERQEISYVLATPTGKAAKRISEVTGRPASTIHRLLGYGGNPDMKKNEGNPIEEEFLIVDEASMVDIFLMSDLLKAMPRNGTLCLLGDVSQIPPVGTGHVFRDTIESGICPVTRLTKIHRQKEGSSIIDIANKIKDGLIPSIQNAGDSFMFEIADPAKAAEKVVELVTRKIPKKFGIPLDDIMTITPIKKGPLGTIALNKLIQDAIHPQKVPTLKHFKLGDRVMQTVNDYGKGVFNGETGKITAIDEESGTLTVAFEDMPEQTEYTYLELDSLAPAFSITVHKSQGSESQCVVLCLHSKAGHYIMLQRDLLYTGVTRTRKLLVIVGDKRAMAIAVNNNATKERYTGLFKKP